MENYLSTQKEHIFRNVQVLIYVFDVESRDMEKDIKYYESIIEAIREHSKDANVFCLIHKMDLIPESQREHLFKEKQIELIKTSEPLKITCFKTSIWDETLYQAWSAIVHSLIPNINTLENHLQKFSNICSADEVVLFEKATFLVISHVNKKDHPDIHRFEKISNIIKQFKLSCSKSQSQFQRLELCHPKFVCVMDSLTSNTFILVVVSDPAIQPALVLHNIKSAREAFSKLELVG
jgi:Ras-related GTP-binding protein A/B